MTNILKSPHATRILIVDDHPAVREALALRIAREADLDVCGEAGDLPEALKLVAETQPDLVVIDMGLKSGSGLELIKRLKSRDSSMRMLVWSMFSEALYADRALRAGAHGYITKDHATEKIIEAIRRVREGKVYLSEPMTERVMTRAVGSSSARDRLPTVEQLSDRELEVFQMIGEGLDTRQVAAKMKLSPKTVETYRSRIKEKLDLKTANELTHRAIHWVERSTVP